MRWSVPRRRSRATSSESSCGHSAQRPRRVAPGMHLQDIAPSLVKPRENDDLLPGLNALEPGQNVLAQLEPNVRRPFAPLARRLAARLEQRADVTDRPNEIVARGHAWPPHSPATWWVLTLRRFQTDGARNRYHLGVHNPRTLRPSS